MNVFPLTFTLDPSTSEPVFKFSSLHLAFSYLSSVQTHPVLHAPTSDCSANIYILYHNQLPPFQNVVESITRSSFRTTGFYLWPNKDAPQSGVWALLLIRLVCCSHTGALLYLSTWDVCVFPHSGWS